MRHREAGDLAHNVALQPNDTVFVPEAPQVFVSERCGTPARMRINPDGVDDPIQPGDTLVVRRKLF